MEFGRSGKELGMLRMCECEREGDVNQASVQFGHLTTPSAYPPHALWSGDPQRHALELWKPGPQPSPQPGIPSSVLPPASFYIMILIPCLTQVICQGLVPGKKLGSLCISSGLPFSTSLGNASRGRPDLASLGTRTDSCHYGGKSWCFSILQFPLRLYHPKKAQNKMAF